MGVTIGGSVQTGYVTFGGAIQGGSGDGGGGAAANTAIGLIESNTIAVTPDFLYQFDGAITDSSTNGRDLTVEAGSIDNDDADASGYVYKHGGQWFAPNGSTNLIYNVDDATLRNSGECTIFAQVCWLEAYAVDGWIAAYGKSGGAEADNWQWALLMDAPNYEWFQEYSTGVGNPENTNYFLKTDIAHDPHTICVRRSDNGDGTWSVDWFFDGRLIDTDTFVDAAEPTGGTDGRLRVCGYDGGGYMSRALVRNVAGYMSALTDAQIRALNSAANGLAA